MNEYFCDGSQQIEANLIGIGILINGENYHMNLPLINSKAMLHEIEAIIKTIEFALERGESRFRIINDDRFLVATIQALQEGRKVTSNGLKRKIRFRDLMKLIKTYNIRIDIPRHVKQREKIAVCHKLSRLYLTEKTTSF